MWRDEKTLSGETVYTYREEGSLIPTLKLMWLGKTKGRNRWAILHASGGTAIFGTLDYAKAEARRMVGL